MLCVVGLVHRPFLISGLLGIWKTTFLPQLVTNMQGLLLGFFLRRDLKGSFKGDIWVARLVATFIFA